MMSRNYACKYDLIKFIQFDLLALQEMIVSLETSADSRPTLPNRPSNNLLVVESMAEHKKNNNYKNRINYINLNNNQDYDSNKDNGDNLCFIILN